MVELGVREGQRLGRRELDPDARQAPATSVGERDRGIDRSDLRGAEQSDELGRQRTRATADVERPLSRPHAGGRDQRTRELAAVAPDEAVIDLRRRAERRRSRYIAHAPSLPAPAAKVKPPAAAR